MSDYFRYTGMQPIVLVVVGPTAVGKTNVAIRLAQHYGTEIVSADARQIFQRTNLGTAKPTPTERQAAPHHLVDFLPVEQDYDVRQFEQDALRALSRIHQTHHQAIVVGGSGLYVQTLVDGIDEMPEVVPGVRQALRAEWQQSGLLPLLGELQRTDPDYYAEVDRANHRRVMRALEVVRSTGRPFSSFRRGQPPAQRPFRSVLIGLEMPRPVLYERIERRVDQMLEQGLVKEVRSLLPYRRAQALRTVGYQEIFPVFDSTYDLSEAIRLVKRNSRRYAKRQLTWFRRDPRVRWFDVSDGTEATARRIVAYVDEMKSRELRIG